MDRRCCANKNLERVFFEKVSGDFSENEVEVATTMKIKSAIDRGGKLKKNFYARELMRSLSIMMV